jgi:hypothetical protein
MSLNRSIMAAHSFGILFVYLEQNPIIYFYNACCSSLPLSFPYPVKLNQDYFLSLFQDIKSISYIDPIFGRLLKYFDTLKKVALYFSASSPYNIDFVHHLQFMNLFSFHLDVPVVCEEMNAQHQ